MFDTIFLNLLVGFSLLATLFIVFLFIEQVLVRFFGSRADEAMVYTSLLLFALMGVYLLGGAIRGTW